MVIISKRTHEVKARKVLFINKNIFYFTQCFVFFHSDFTFLSHLYCIEQTVCQAQFKALKLQPRIRQSLSLSTWGKCFAEDWNGVTP